MNYDLLQVVFYLLLVDSIIASVIAWSARDWYIKHFRLMSRWFPVTKGWTTYYLILVAYIGYLTFMIV